MKGLGRYNEKYFARYKDKPVQIKPYDPQTRILAGEYLAKLQTLISKWKIKPVLRGSTAFGVAGKGEIEIGLYPKNKDWYDLVIFLINHFRGIGNLEADYARFNDLFKGQEIEIILMKGYQARVDKKLFEFLITHLKVLKEYEMVKRKYSFSKKEYMIQKHQFFDRIIKSLPE